jgi:Ca-activated chloride channel family protein
LTRKIAVASVRASKQNDALPQLWARSRIARLSDFATEPGTSEPEITALGLQYALLTPYTSFIAVLEQVRNPSRLALDTNVPVALPLGMTELDEDCGAYAAGAEPELIWLLASALLALALVKLRSKPAESR